MRTQGFALACLLVPAALGAQRTGGGTPPPAAASRIIVGAEMLVSQDGDVPHIETMIAANPRDPRNLIGGSIVGGRPGGGFHCKTYASHDGGKSWIDRSFPELVRWGGADPQVAFTPKGTAIFTCLSLAPDATGRARAFLLAWRSEDGGLTWSARPSDLGASYDHEMLAVDQSVGRFAGRIYMTALYGREYRLGLFRSEDDGRTWIGPVEFTNGGSHGVNVTPLKVFSDGALFISWVDFPITPRQDSTWPGSHYWSAISTDGGITVAPPRRIVPLGARGRRNAPDARLRSDPGFAIDPSEAHRDRVYMVWTDFTAAGPRVALVRSEDRGATWSRPLLVDSTVPAAAKQFQPRIAVNREGTIGISFYDTRGVADGGWHEYFTASIDGGNTFLAPVRVSGEPSLASGRGNTRLEPLVYADGSGRVSLSLLSGASRWSNGGDYLGMAVDTLGTFHPLWADARTGTFQLWTASIRVERPPPAAKPHPLDEFLPRSRSAVALVRPTGAAGDVSKQLEFLFDPTVHDVSTGEIALRVRLRNISSDSIFAPLQVEVAGFGGPMERDAAGNAPAILNASNGMAGVGAVFEFGGALGTDQLLAPGALSGAMLWRLRVRDPRSTPTLQLTVRGTVRRDD